MYLVLVLNGLISDNHVKKYGKAVLTVPADGMCFLTSVQMCMKWDLSIDYSLDEIKEKILNEVIDNLDLYQNYHTGNKLKLVQDTLAYMNLNKFTLDVVDVVVNACGKLVLTSICTYSVGMVMMHFYFLPLVTTMSPKTNPFFSNMTGLVVTFM